MIHINTILHPTDFSQTAQQARYVAELLAHDHGAKLVLLHVCRPPTSGSESILKVDDAQERLTSIAKTIGQSSVESSVISGEPGPLIVASAHKWNADLIVMGTHGQTGLDQLLIGSVAEHVVRNAPCAVLTLRPGAAWGLTQEQEEAPQKDRPAVVV